mgnify:CR=1 FL=1
MEMNASREDCDIYCENPCSPGVKYSEKDDKAVVMTAVSPNATTPYMRMVDLLLRYNTFRRLMDSINDSVRLLRQPAVSADGEQDRLRDILMINENSFGEFIVACYNAVVDRDNNKLRTEEVFANITVEVLRTIPGFYKTYSLFSAYPALFRFSDITLWHSDSFLDRMIMHPENFRRIYPTIQFLLQVPSAAKLFQLDEVFPEDDMNFEPEPTEDPLEYFRRGDFIDYNQLIFDLAYFIGY